MLHVLELIKLLRMQAGDKQHQHPVSPKSRHKWFPMYYCKTPQHDQKTMTWWGSPNALLLKREKFEYFTDCICIYLGLREDERRELFPSRCSYFENKSQLESGAMRKFDVWNLTACGSHGYSGEIVALSTMTRWWNIWAEPSKTRAVKALRLRSFLQAREYTLKV